MSLANESSDCKKTGAGMEEEDVVEEGLKQWSKKAREKYARVTGLLLRLEAGENLRTKWRQNRFRTYTSFFIYGSYRLVQC